MKIREPKTPAEWQDAVDCAEFYLLVDSAEQCGLIKGGPVVDLSRCEEILKKGRKLGIYPASIEELCRRFAGRRS
jgi:hypothetical protein